ncbi:MAG: hypothetical protein Q7T03_01400 [Deltaproteobacteria bacterium]|nr:hypothetical protein [Deltaproteobacteria bacterium]
MLTFASPKLKSFTLLAILLTLYWTSCSHRKTDMTPTPAPGFGGGATPVGGSVSIVEPPSSGGAVVAPPATGVSGFVCPSDGSYFVVDPYVAGNLKLLGPLAARSVASLGEYQGHGGGRFGDVQSYAEGGSTYILLSAGRSLNKKNFPIGDENIAQTELSSPIRKLVVVPGDNKTGVLAATDDSLVLLETSGAGSFVPVHSLLLPSAPMTLSYDGGFIYVALNNGSIHRLTLETLKNGGCIERIARMESYDGRVVRKISASGTRLFVFSEKKLSPSKISLNGIPRFLNPLGEVWRENFARYIEGLWNPDFARIDMIDLGSGLRSPVLTDQWNGLGDGAGRVQVTDFVVEEGRLLVSVERMLTTRQNTAFQADLRRMMSDKCGGAQTRCERAAQVILESYWLKLLLGNLAAGAYPELIDYSQKPAGLMVFDSLDVNYPSNPGVILPAMAGASTPENYNIGFWGMQLAGAGENVYMMAPRAVLHFHFVAGQDVQVDLIDSQPMDINNLDQLIPQGQQVLKALSVSQNNERAVFRLAGKTINGSLEQMLLGNAVVKKTLKEPGLPVGLLGKKLDKIYTTMNMGEFGVDMAAVWSKADAGVSRSGFLELDDWDWTQNKIAWDANSGLFTMAGNVEGNYQVFLGNAASGELSSSVADISPVVEENLSEAGDPLDLPCTRKTESYLKSVRTLTLPNHRSPTHFMLFADHVGYQGAGCFARSDVGLLVLKIYQSGSNRPLEQIELAVLPQAGRAAEYKADFVGDVRLIQNGPHSFGLVRAEEGLFLFRRALLPPPLPVFFLTKTKLVAKRDLADLVISTGFGRDLILAKRRAQFVQFYRFLWDRLLDPTHFDRNDRIWPALSFDENREIAYDMPLEPLAGSLENILELGEDHYLLKLVLPEGQNRVEHLKIEGTHFKRQAMQDLESIWDWALDPRSPRELVFSTGNEGLVFYRLNPY